MGEELPLDLKSDRGRVRAAILIYLAIFVGLNMAVWSWFAVNRNTLGHHFPVGDRMQRFGDLVLFTAKDQVMKDPRLPNYDNINGTLFPRNYPPLSVLLYLFLLQKCAPYAIPVYLVIVLGGVALACTLLWRRVRQFGGYRWYIGAAIFATGLFGWGTEETVIRGNIEGVMWDAVCLGAAFYACRRYKASAMMFGIASCLKPYPVLWFVVLALHRKYREVALGLATGAMVTLASLLVIDRNPLRAYQSIGGKSNFFANYIVAFRPMEEMKGNHSLLESMKTVARVIRYHGFNFPFLESLVRPNDPLAWKLYHAYLPIAAVIGLVTLWGVWNKPVLNQIFALACVTTVLPLVSGDYTLSVLLVPMGFFLIYLLQDVAEGHTNLTLGKMLWFLLPCAWIMATEPLITLHAVLKCVAVLVLMGASILIPMPSTLFGENPSHAT